MKWQTIIVLAAIALSIVIPPSLPFMTDRGVASSIGTLDVCHAAVPAVTAGGEMPWIDECPCLPSPFAMTEILQTTNLSLHPFFIPFQDERPPKA